MIPQSNAQSEAFDQQPVLQRSGQYFVPSRPETREYAKQGCLDYMKALTLQDNKK